MVHSAANVQDKPRVMVLSIGVGCFDEGTGWEELGFVAERVAEVGAAFDRFDVRVERALDPTEVEIEGLLRRWILTEERSAADVVVIHLIGHGTQNPGGRLCFIGRDGEEVDVDRWIGKAQSRADRAPDGPRTVFLVDTCDAGTATGRQSLTDLGTDRGVWALGAAVSGSPTQRGRFTGWLAAALHRLADRDFALEVPAVDFKDFALEMFGVVRQEEEWRISVGFSLELGDGDWPFLPNPKAGGLSREQIERRRGSFGYVPGQDLGTTIATGADISDANYFVDRASGRGLVSVPQDVGFFSGRAEQLAAYRSWWAGDSPLMVVTGAVGSGKSGLLGAVVCAAHPELRRRFRQVWEPADRDLPEIAEIVAVHARQRTAQQLIDMIVSQAGLTPPAPEKPGIDDGEDNRPGATHWTVHMLREALYEEDKRRLVVIDALDESAEPDTVVRLIEALVVPSEKKTPQAPPCRILTGSRPETVAELPKALEDGSRGVLLDLDKADRTVVKDDVRHYIAALLRASEPYADGAASEYVDIIAATAANNIAGQGTEDTRWGPFLLAGMFVHYMVTRKKPPQDLADANAHAGRAAGDLPTILEAVLDARHHAFPLLRPVLHVLARSKGDGMPLTVLRRCVEAFHDGSRQSDAVDFSKEQFTRTLVEASPFLYSQREPGGKVALYRLFHQGLADYLRTHPWNSLDAIDTAGERSLEGVLFGALVAPHLGAREGEDSWADAEPYVLRHALDHVAAASLSDQAEALLTDPYFLVRFDPRQDPRPLDLAASASADEYRRLLATSWSAHSELTGGADRASVLAYDAHRLGMTGKQTEFTAMARALSADRQGVSHCAVWARGGASDTRSRLIHSRSTMIHEVAFSPDGELLAAATHGGVEVRSAETWQLVTPPFGRTERWVEAVAFSPDGRRLAFNTGESGQRLRMWDVETRSLTGASWPAHTGQINSVAFSPDGRMLAAGGEDHTVSVWDITANPPVEVARTRHEGAVADVAFSPDGRSLVSCGRAGLALLGMDDERKTTWLADSWSVAVAFSPDGTQLACLDSDGDVSLWATATREVTDTVSLGDVAVSGGLSFSPDGSCLAAGTSGSLKLVDMASTEVIGDLGKRDRFVQGVAFRPTPPLQLVSCALRGSLRLWKTLDQDLDDEPLDQFTSELVACSLDGRFLVVADNEESALRMYEPVSGRKLGEVPLGRHTIDEVLGFSPTGHLLAMLSAEKSLLLLRADTQPHPRIEVVSTSVKSTGRESCAFSPDGGLLAMLVTLGQPSFGAVTYPTLIKIWDTRSLRLTGRVPLPGRPDRFHFTGPDKLFVSMDGAIAVYDCSGPDKEPL
ncbi:nSTAND1 domain-containing NTPase [Streptomyces sp. NPDC001780]